MGRTGGVPGAAALVLLLLGVAAGPSAWAQGATEAAETEATATTPAEPKVTIGRPGGAGNAAGAAEAEVSGRGWRAKDLLGGEIETGAGLGEVADIAIAPEGRAESVEVIDRGPFGLVEERWSVPFHEVSPQKAATTFPLATVEWTAPAPGGGRWTGRAGGPIWDHHWKAKEILRRTVAIEGAGVAGTAHDLLFDDAGLLRGIFLTELEGEAGGPAPQGELVLAPLAAAPGAVAQVKPGLFYYSMPFEIRRSRGERPSAARQHGEQGGRPPTASEHGGEDAAGAEAAPPRADGIWAIVGGLSEAMSEAAKALERGDREEARTTLHEARRAAEFGMHAAEGLPAEVIERGHGAVERAREALLTRDKPEEARRILGQGAEALRRLLAEHAEAVERERALAGGAGPGAPRPSLEGFVGAKVINARGAELGEVEAFARGEDGAPYAVVAVGGVLGLGDKEVAIPIEELVFGHDRVAITSSVSKEDLERMPAYGGGRHARQAGD